MSDFIIPEPDLQDLAPGVRGSLLLAVADYLKSFAQFYDDPLKNHPSELKAKYLKLPFLIQISTKLIEEAEKLKLEDYQVDGHTVLDNDFLKICFGYHELYDLLLLKCFTFTFTPRYKLESEFDYFHLTQDPFCYLPMLIALFIEKHVNKQDLDVSYKAYEKLSTTFLKDYTNSNPLYKKLDKRIVLTDDVIMSIWLKFSENPISCYDAEAVDGKVEELRAKGNQYYKDKLYAEAAVAYTRGLHFNPNSYNLLSNRGAVYSALNLGELAVKDITKAVELQPSSVSAWARLAFNNLYTGRAVESIKCYNNAILAAHGALLPLHLRNKNEEEKRDYSDSIMRQLNRKFVAKLCDSLQLARSRAETQGYPVQYLEDLIDPFVKKIFPAYSTSSSAARTSQAGRPSTALSADTTATGPNARQNPAPIFNDIFAAVTSNVNGAPDFQQIFNSVQEQISAQSGNTNNGPAQLGLSMLSDIMGSFMSGTPQANNPTPPLRPTNTTQRNNTENVEMGEAGDADPDIDLDQIIEDQSQGPVPNRTTANPGMTPNVVVTSFSGSEMPREIRDQLGRVAGGFFNLFGGQGTQAASAGNANGGQRNDANRNNEAQRGSGGSDESMDPDLD